MSVSAGLDRRRAGISRSRVTALAGIAAGVAAGVLVLLAPTGWPALVGALLLACVCPGAAVMGWIDSGEDAAQAGLTLAVSLALFALAATVMIWSADWQPRALVVFAGLSVLSGAVRLSRGGAR